MMRGFLSPNFKSISVPIAPSSGTTKNSYGFPTQEDLQRRKIVAIETYSNSDISVDPENSDNIPIDTLLFPAAFLTLYTSAVGNPAFPVTEKQEPGLFYQRIPFARLRILENNYTDTSPRVGIGNSFARDLFVIRPTELNWNKCAVEFPTPQVLTVTNQSAIVGVHYLDEGDNGEWFLEYILGFKQRK